MSKARELDEDVLREYLLKETEIVQGIISRMANTSFLIKGWSVTLIVASLLLERGVYHHFIAFVPWFVFWCLDAYFLCLERLYRKLYDWLIKNRLKTDEYLLDMNIDRFRKELPCIIQTFFSKTLVLFYGLLLIIILVTVLINFCA